MLRDGSETSTATSPTTTSAAAATTTTNATTQPGILYNAYTLDNAVHSLSSTLIY